MFNFRLSTVTRQQHHRARLTPLWVMIFLLILTPANIQARSPQPKLNTINISIEGVNLVAEVAAHSQHRQKGLSYRTSLGENEGMLFVYQKSQLLLFTMRETLIPLSIAFISEDLTINEILEMEPGAIENYPSKFSSKFALEMNQAWFEKNNISPGHKLDIQL